MRKHHKIIYTALGIAAVLFGGYRAMQNDISLHLLKPYVPKVSQKEAYKQEPGIDQTKKKKQENTVYKHWKKIEKRDRKNRFIPVRHFSQKPFVYQNGKRKLVLGQLDSLGRATGSHIQLKESQTPTKKRSAYLTVRPSGWHNYKFTANINGKRKTTWLYNRGHLVGYQFCGLNNEKRNLITETTYLNQGSLGGMNSQNDKAMLFYENHLRKWMIMHPSCSLDYSVVPLYRDNDMIARGVELTFVGYNKRGHKMRIKMPTKRITYHNAVSQVFLKNNAPGAPIKINYQTGRAE